jgi:ribosomal protein S18 acetylase RimI-like enzyme
MNLVVAPGAGGRGSRPVCSERCSTRSVRRTAAASRSVRVSNDAAIELYEASLPRPGRHRGYYTDNRGTFDHGENRSAVILGLETS